MAEETTEEKRIFRTLHLILETQKMIAFYNGAEDEGDINLFEARQHKDFLKLLIFEINQDLLPHNVGLFALNLERE